MSHPMRMVAAFLALVCAGAVAGQTDNPPARNDTPTSDGRAGAGKGIFVTGPRAMTIFPDSARNNPYVAGFQLNLGWAELEPEKGKYDWSRIDQLISDCRKRNKKAAFKFGTVGGKVMSDGQLSYHKKQADENDTNENTVTPAWLFKDPAVKRLGGFKTPKGMVPLYPVFWDPAYQKHLEEFIAAMAQRYDGCPELEYIRMGGWQVGTNEPSFYGGATGFLAAQLAEQGMALSAADKKKDTIRGLAGDSPYSKAVIAMIDLWLKHFKKTRLASTIHFSKEAGSFEEAMMSHCFKNRIAIMNTGLNEGDHAEPRKEYREAHDKYGCKVAWGGITHLGSKRAASELPAGHTVRMEAVMQGIGDDANPAYAPASRVSYLVTGFDFAEEAATAKWACEHLSQ